MLSIKKLLTDIISDGKTKNSTLTINKGTAGQNWCKKKCGVVEFYVESTGISWGTGWNTIATLPSGYEPPLYYDFVAKDNTNDTACSCKITAGGEVQVYKTSSVSNHVRIHGIHFAGGGYSLTALFRVFSRLAERWWEYAERKETAYKDAWPLELEGGKHNNTKHNNSERKLHLDICGSSNNRKHSLCGWIPDYRNREHGYKCIWNACRRWEATILCKEHVGWLSDNSNNRILACKRIALISERGWAVC